MNKRKNDGDISLHYNEQVTINQKDEDYYLPIELWVIIFSHNSEILMIDEYGNEWKSFDRKSLCLRIVCRTWNDNFYKIIKTITLENFIGTRECYRLYRKLEEIEYNCLGPTKCKLTVCRPHTSERGHLYDTISSSEEIPAMKMLKTFGISVGYNDVEDVIYNKELSMESAFNIIETSGNKATMKGIRNLFKNVENLVINNFTHVILARLCFLNITTFEHLNKIYLPFLSEDGPLCSYLLFLIKMATDSNNSLEILACRRMQKGHDAFHSREEVSERLESLLKVTS